MWNKFGIHQALEPGAQSQVSTCTCESRWQLVRYLQQEASCSAPGFSVLQFWQEMAKKLPTLSKLAYKVISVPASSAPVERVFSRGGTCIIMRPHRARLSAEMLGMLMFLKCNESVCLKWATNGKIFLCLLHVHVDRCKLPIKEMAKVVFLVSMRIKVFTKSHKVLFDS